ncbi:FdhF/YdeP family oxidoreductase [Chitinimonas koreensis]|uniref:FdhF/YdeP family oxidoreductase n=1 Tax=Chitinimonas koreensis TaxID=356302 RepID=UPI0004903A17|nr:FdhF/YdeP family oxidoreductase [Chitinimonas koreensis]
MDTPDRPEAHSEPYDRPAGGWGALGAVRRTFRLHRLPIKGPLALLRANQHHGFDCPGCAWPDRNDGRTVDACENGMKAVAAELTARLATPDLFAAHTLAELRRQTDFELEDHGRLTEPLCYDAASDRYLPISWDDALARAAAVLRATAPEAAAFYASGRSSNEAAFLWQLLARAYGSNNLPDSSNLCHEPSGYAMKEVIGVGKGTATLDDFDQADLIVVIGQNPATNHPRMMGTLHAAVRRGAKVLAFNPLKERGFVSFADPQDPAEMLTGRGLAVAHRIYQVKIGGDLAALKGVMKALLAQDAAARAAGGAALVDEAFIAAHTEGYAALRDDLAMEDWALIEAESGLARAQMEEAAALYAASERTIATWCMGITHHEHSVATVQTIVYLLLLRGNVGRPGCGAVPVRGHSNVQGDRTMGVTSRPPARWLDNLAAEFGIEPPRRDGRDAIETVGGLLDGSVQAFLSLGGNFAAAAPDTARLTAALSRCTLTVHIATKFNRTHCYPGQLGLILPCLARTDRDLQDGVEQFVTVEDSMSMVHASQGFATPRSAHQRSEPAIVAGLGHALLGEAPIDWLGLARDYGRIRERIERCMAGVFDGYQDFNARVGRKGGFRLVNAASERRWATPSGKAQFRVHPVPTDGPVHRARAVWGDTVLALMTIRSHDQYNTTVYGQDDRYRGIFGGRHVVLIHPADLARLGFAAGDYVDLHARCDDGEPRSVHGFRLVPYDIPAGCIAAYFPEATPLVGRGLVSRYTRTPASKEIPVQLARSAVQRAGGGR